MPQEKKELVIKKSISDNQLVELAEEIRKTFSNNGISLREAF